MKLNFPAGVGIFEDPSGVRWTPDVNGQVDIAGANPDPFLVGGFTYVTDPVSATGGRPVPPNTYPGMPWFDASLNAGAGLPIWRNASNNGWINGAGSAV